MTETHELLFFHNVLILKRGLDEFAASRLWENSYQRNSSLPVTGFRPRKALDDSRLTDQCLTFPRNLSFVVL